VLLQRDHFIDDFFVTSLGHRLELLNFFPCRDFVWGSLDRLNGDMDLLDGAFGLGALLLQIRLKLLIHVLAYFPVGVAHRQQTFYSRLSILGKLGVCFFLDLLRLEDRT